MTTYHNDDYRIALRPYTVQGGKGQGYTEELLDDIVIKDVKMVHIEDMGGYFWMACYLTDEPDNDRICFQIAKSRKGIEITVSEPPEGDYVFEGES
jgi:hypothetical protein